MALEANNAYVEVPVGFAEEEMTLVLPTQAAKPILEALSEKIRSLLRKRVAALLKVCPNPDQLTEDNIIERTAKHNLPVFNLNFDARSEDIMGQKKSMLADGLNETDIETVTAVVLRSVNFEVDSKDRTKVVPSFEYPIQEETAKRMHYAREQIQAAIDILDSIDPITDQPEPSRSPKGNVAATPKASPEVVSSATVPIKDLIDEDCVFPSLDSIPSLKKENPKLYDLLMTRISAILKGLINPKKRCEDGSFEIDFDSKTDDVSSGKKFARLQRERGWSIPTVGNVRKAWSMTDRNKKQGWISTQSDLNDPETLAELNELRSTLQAYLPTRSDEESVDVDEGTSEPAIEDEKSTLVARRRKLEEGLENYQAEQRRLEETSSFLQLEINDCSKNIQRKGGEVTQKKTKLGEIDRFLKEGPSSSAKQGVKRQQSHLDRDVRSLEKEIRKAKNKSRDKQQELGRITRQLQSIKANIQKTEEEQLEVEQALDDLPESSAPERKAVMPNQETDRTSKDEEGIVETDAPVIDDATIMAALSREVVAGPANAFLMALANEMVDDVKVQAVKEVAHIRAAAQSEVAKIKAAFETELEAAEATLEEAEEAEQKLRVTRESLGELSADFHSLRSWLEQEVAEVTEMAQA